MTWDDGSPVNWSLPLITVPPEEESYYYEGDGGFEEELETPGSSLGPTSLFNFSRPPIFDNCSEPLSHVAWGDPALVSSLAILVAINGLVVGGNVLVIIAVFSTPKLRTVTNLFIASLAVADLLLGVAVLPFSVTVEVFHTWLFGELWCSVWLAVDVWMSTASILNLCVISLDR